MVGRVLGILVRSIKKCLKKNLGHLTLSFEGLRTYLVEIEATINNRLFSYMYADDENKISFPLTLIHGRCIIRNLHYEVTSTSKALTTVSRPSVISTFRLALIDSGVKRVFGGNHHVKSPNRQLLVKLSCYTTKEQPVVFGNWPITRSLIWR